MGGSIPFFVWTIELGVITVLVVAVIIQSILLWKLHKRLATFMVGKDAASLEATLAWLTEKSASVDGTLDAHKEALEHIDRRVKRSIRGYSLVRYDAYENGGGEQSFASGLLDEHGDGYILSVITNRNHVGVYAKKVRNRKADGALTTEENRALQEALHSFSS